MADNGFGFIPSLGLGFAVTAGLLVGVAIANIIVSQIPIKQTRKTLQGWVEDIGTESG